MLITNYIASAWRNILRRKLYATINIVGLSMGLGLYVFGALLSDYEHSHDTMFKNHDRAYTLRSDINPDSGFGLTQGAMVYSAVAPIIKTELTEVDYVARTKTREFLISREKNNHYQTVRFSDPEILQIFDFDYLHGDSSALDTNSGIVITSTIARKLFGDENPMGQILTFNNEHDLTVTAVIKDVSKNSHFNSSFFGYPLEVLLPINSMITITGFDPDENWGQLRGYDLTYVTIPEQRDDEWLQEQIDGIYQRHYPEDKKEFITKISVHPLIDANLSVWAVYDIPVFEIISALGYLVMLIACINYANLATAQAMGRAREIGLRKTLGAGPIQLLLQFIIESTTIASLAMIITFAALELVIPAFNVATGKVLFIDYIAILPWITFVIFVVGVCSGAYPAYLITKINPIEALKDGVRKGKSSAWVRELMIGIQFTISVFMLALLFVVIAQNRNVVESSDIFAKDQIYVIDRIESPNINERHDILKNEILTIPGVENYSYSLFVPFEDLNDTFKSSTSPDVNDNVFTMYRMAADHEFLDVYDIPLVAGRNFSPNIAFDLYSPDRENLNVIINELAANNLGFKTPQDAIGTTFYRDFEDPYTIIGVVKDQNLYGLQNEIRPFTFLVRPPWYRHASVKLSQTATPQTIREIENTWNRIVPEYPLQAKFLDDWFEEVYRLFDISAKILTGFSVFSLALALIGLFGLSAFMAEQRTREIGIRKVLGAKTNQIVSLLVWQFSKPVFWATPFAMAIAYLASNMYLEFFSERIALPISSLLIAAGVALILSWLTVAFHALNIARTNPIEALRYE